VDFTDHSSRLNIRKIGDNEDYEDFLGQEAYKDHVVNPFDDFLHEAFHESTFN